MKQRKYILPLTQRLKPRLLAWLKDEHPTGKTNESEIQKAFDLSITQTNLLVREMIKDGAIMKVGFKNNWDIEIRTPPADLSPFHFQTYTDFL